MVQEVAEAYIELLGFKSPTSLVVNEFIILETNITLCGKTAFFQMSTENYKRVRQIFVPYT